MSTTQQLISELEKQQQKLAAELAQMQELAATLPKRHQENLSLIKNKVMASLNPEKVMAQNPASKDTLGIDPSQLNVPNQQIQKALEEIFKI